METINAAETLASVALHHGHEPKFWAAAALCNLSWTTEFSAKLVNDASAHRPQRDNEKGGRGIVKVLRSLLEADLAPKVALEVKVKCTLALYNMAMCSPEVSERLVDDGVTVLLRRSSRATTRWSSSSPSSSATTSRSCRAATSPWSATRSGAAS